MEAEQSSSSLSKDQSTADSTCKSPIYCGNHYFRYHVVKTNNYCSYTLQNHVIIHISVLPTIV